MNDDNRDKITFGCQASGYTAWDYITDGLTMFVAAFLALMLFCYIFPRERRLDPAEAIMDCPANHRCKIALDTEGKMTQWLEGLTPENQCELFQRYKKPGDTEWTYYQRFMPSKTCTYGATK